MTDADADSPPPVPCVRVRPESGEDTRARLAAEDLLDRSREITGEDGWLYLPVEDPDAVSERHGDLAVVEYPAPRRERQQMPADLLDFEPTYERLGDIVVLDEDDPERARAAADAVVASALDAKTVVNRASPVQGETRVREWDVLHGEDTETVHREYGCEFALDIAAVYFSPRLATERHRVVEQVAPDEHVFDMFAGVGPFVIPAAKRGAEAVGVDVNPAAVRYLRGNAERNGVADRVTAVEGDVRAVAGEWAGWADRVMMNLPHSADAFLDAAVTLAGEECVLHYYDIQHEDDPYGPGEAAIREAATAADAGQPYDVTVETRHTVRSYAPHELNVVLDVRLERRD
ncbi:MAG: class I SAM-dependent methyltransferase family protein [Halobacteriaceae archaeon]